MPMSSLLIHHWLDLKRLGARLQTSLAVYMYLFNPFEDVWVLKLLREDCPSVVIRPVDRILRCILQTFLLLFQLDVLKQLARLDHGVA